MDSFLFENRGITQVCFFLFKENYRSYLFIVFDFVLALNGGFVFLCVCKFAFRFFLFPFFPAFCLRIRFFLFPFLFTRVRIL